MNNIKDYMLVDKERIEYKGNPYFRLYLWDQQSGEVIQVLAPIDPKERKIIKEGIFNVI